VAAFLFVFALNGYADEKPKLKAVTVEDNYPYNFKSNGVIQGMGFDVATALADRTGYQLAAEAIPWSRALQTAQAQPAVLIFSIVRIPERENLFYWIGPFSTTEVWLYKFKSHTAVQIQNLGDVKNYLVGDTRDNATLPLLKQLGIRVDTAPSDLSSCRKFKIGRVDLVPIDSNAVQAFMASCDIGIDEVEKVIQLRKDSSLYIALGRNTDPELVNRLGREFDSMKKDGTLQTISEKWTRRSSMPRQP
jgi:polar amino acid transport system substrate-binding protein